MNNHRLFTLIAFPPAAIPFILILCFLCTGCSLKTIAVRHIGDALAAGGTTFAYDDDPLLIKEAVPFSLKLMESLLAENPSHRGLLLACAKGFTQYSFAFVELEAEEMEEMDFSRAMEMRNRSRRLYLRGRDYGLRGLEEAYPGFTMKLQTNPKEAVRKLKLADVPFAYWTAVSWAGAISILKDRADLIADIPSVEALIDRTLELDEDFDHGAIHSFLIAYEMNRQSGTGNPEKRARDHFQRAMELAEGQLCGPLVALGENVSLAKQDKNEFQSLMQQALEVAPDKAREYRLENLIMQRRARWLLSRKNELFLD